MGRPFSIDVRCSECEQTSNLIVDYEDRNGPQVCPLCQGGPASRVYTTVNNFRVALHSGVKREGFAELKEAARLKAESYNMPYKERTSINKEIGKLKSTRK